VIGGYAFIGAVVIAVLHSCTGCTPVEGEHRRTELKQEGELAICITTAKALDASHDERMTAYTKCADDVDRDAGRIP